MESRDGDGSEIVKKDIGGYLTISNEARLALNFCKTLSEQTEGRMSRY